MTSAFMKLENQLLSGKTALVTGAGANIGRHIALELARAGASIVAVDVNSNALDALVAELDQEGMPATHAVVADIGDRASISHLVSNINQAGRSIDILVNNVGIHTDTEGAQSGDFDNWQKTFDTNLIGPYHLTRIIAQTLIDRGANGNVIFVSSIHQWQARGHPAYSASKAAVGMVVKELAHDLAEFGIRVNGIAPGAVRNDDEVDPSKRLRVPLHGTKIPASYIGRCAVFLASEYFSKFTTGSIITVDAGLLARGFLNPPTHSP